MSTTQFNRQNVCVRDGVLYLTLQRTDSEVWWQGAQVQLAADAPDSFARLGTGTYDVDFDQVPGDTLHNSVLAFFLFGGAGGAQEDHDEIDVELTRAWGDASPLQYVVWPAATLDDGRETNLDPVAWAQMVPSSRHRFDWMSDRVQFTSHAIVGGVETALLKTATIGPNGIVVPQQPLMPMLNYWMWSDSDDVNVVRDKKPKSCLNKHTGGCGSWTIAVRSVHLPVAIAPDAPENLSVTGVPGSAHPLTLHVTDAAGHGLPNAVVDVAVFGGGAASVASTNSDASGRVAITWTLGTAATQSLSVTVRNSSSNARQVVYTATVPQPPLETLLFSDDFAGDLSHWVVKDPNGLGSWTIQSQELIGDYNIGCGSSGCHQTQLVLVDSLQPGGGNWRMEVQSGLVQAYCCYNGGAIVNLAKFALWVSDSEKEIFEVGHAWVGTPVPSTFSAVYVYHQAYPWHAISPAPLQAVAQWTPGAWQTAVLEKVGDQYSVYFNGTLAYTTTRTFTGLPKLGLQTYGKVRMDNFKLFSIP